MFRDEFKAEIEYLFQLCEELGRSEPTLAPLLGRGADASVERLLEGLAFSFARLRQRLDDDMPELIHPIVENLCPELLRPIPSGTIVELSPSPKMMSRTLVRAGATFASKPDEAGGSCFFRSSADREVSPWSLTRVEVRPSDRRSVRLSLKLFTGAELASTVPDKLVLFLAHPVAVALEARAFLLRNVCTIHVRSPETGIALEWPSTAFSSSRDARTTSATKIASAEAFLTMRDYLVFPQSFAFVELAGFGAIRELGQGTRTIEISLELSEALPRGIELDVSNVRIHAVPTLNLFRPPKVSRALGGDKRRCTLRFDGALADIEVHSVEHVALVSRGLRSIPLEPWAKLFYPRITGAEARYEVLRTPSVLDSSLDVSISFSGEGIDALLADKVAAEVEVLATNGDRACQVEIGGVCVPTATSPSFMTFRNVTPVTRSAPPAIAEDRLWQFYRLVKANLAALTDTETLAAVLALANVPAQFRWPEAKPDAETFTPLLRVSRTRLAASHREQIRAGALVRVELDVRRFTGLGDIRLFGEVLLPVLTASMSTCDWIELELVDSQRSPLERFPRTYGERIGF